MGAAPFGKWVHPVSAEAEEDVSALGGKGSGLVLLRRLGLPVPPAFVVGTEACRIFLRDGRFPDGLDDELDAAIAVLEADTGRRFGGTDRPLVVSVRSGGSVSMPGMMSTVLDLGLTDATTAALAAETGDRRFALDSRQRLLTSFASAVHGLGAEELAAAARRGARAPESPEANAAAALADVEAFLLERTGDRVPDDARDQLDVAVRSVFRSWNTPRARTYRTLHGIPDDLGTAVVVQAMVFGNRDDRSGSGVAFSRDPNTGARTPFGEVLFARQGEDVVSGTSATEPLGELAEREPEVWAGLLDAMGRIEEHYRDSCYVEFTFESGRLWLLQVRRGRFTGGAATRVAVDLVDESVITRDEALLRVSPQDLRALHTPRVDTAAGAVVLTRGLGACPGVAVGRLATTADKAVRMAADGPVVLVRPHTSPADIHGLAAAAGVVTAHGGPASHAAVVARSMAKPAVVGAADLTVDAAEGQVRVGARTLTDGDTITIDGGSGEVVLGESPVTTATADPRLHRLLDWADEVSGRTAGTEQDRLEAAHAVLRPDA
ncbi:pyruvate, phosphate dikinase [Alloactinosynnema sp. L-07]|uniref:pyruvate, phosphate dikinase n=1 Tax=Alloactinosynnema sp. L-07 TaxID=1653480 RepID=UPI000ADE1242|nr:pyruvate, phosphate dikinase [Alloactinosynnema sp. L-07]